MLWAVESVFWHSYGSHVIVSWRIYMSYRLCKLQMMMNSNELHALKIRLFLILELPFSIQTILSKNLTDCWTWNIAFYIMRREYTLFYMHKTFLYSSDSPKTLHRTSSPRYSFSLKLKNVSICNSSRGFMTIYKGVLNQSSQ